MTVPRLCLLLVFALMVSSCHEYPGISDQANSVPMVFWIAILTFFGWSIWVAADLWDTSLRTLVVVGANLAALGLFFLGGTWWFSLIAVVTLWLAISYPEKNITITIRQSDCRAFVRHRFPGSGEFILRVSIK